MIVFRDVVKRFGTHVAVDGLSVPIARGEVVALLGPNGCGKTTTLKIAAGLIKPDAGEVVVGEPPLPPWMPSARGVLSFLPQRVSFPEALTGREVVEFYRKLREGRGQARVRPGSDRGQTQDVLRFASLNGAADRPVATYSGGMTQRLGLAVAMLPDADALLLDEPTAALDPDGLCAFYGLIQNRRAQGKTVFFSSHQVGDVEQLADRFLVLVNGRLVAELTQAALRDRLAERGFIRLRLDRCPPPLLESVRRVSAKAVWTGDELIVPGDAEVRAAVLDGVRTFGAEIRGLVAHDGPLETFYRELVSGAADHRGGQSQQETPA